MSDRTESVLATLKQDGYRLTKARMGIVDVALSAGAPVSAQDVAEALGRRDLHPNVTTVYRELEFLRGLGILEGVGLADGVQRYEEAGLGHHHHLVCTGCKAIADVVLPHENLHETEQAIAAQYGFTVSGHALEFHGRCAKCR